MNDVMRDDTLDPIGSKQVDNCLVKLKEVLISDDLKLACSLQ